MLPEEITAIETILGENPAISKFFGNWILREIERARDAKPYHVCLGFLAPPYRHVFAEQIGELFDTVIRRAPSQLPKWRKKLTESRGQNQFESVLFELEIDCLFLEHGYETEVEPPCGSKKPDLRAKIGGQNVYFEAKKLQNDAETKLVQAKARRDSKDEKGIVWSRNLTQEILGRMEQNLASEYLMDGLFPDDGLHLLVIDSLKRGRGDRLVLKAWKSNPPPSINSLVMCRRQGYWLNSLKADARVFQNPLSPLPSEIYELIQRAFGGN